MSSCTDPLFAVRLYRKEDGKQVIKIKSKSLGYETLCSHYGKENVLLLPCGHCLACISKKKKEWSVRCALEALDHEESCFLTLTYDDVSYLNIKGLDDVKSDMLDFIKDLRNRGYKVRYFGCGEKGDCLGRMHGHLILFGFFPKDSKPFCKSPKGVHQFLSKFLSDIWNKGLLTVEEFSPYAASYVAGYVVKKMNEKDDSFHIQSTRPGLGAGYVLRNIQDIYEDDKLILTFGSHLFSVPRYFDKIALNLGMDLDDVKARRMSFVSSKTAHDMRDHSMQYFGELLVHNDQVNAQRIINEKRGF